MDRGGPRWTEVIFPDPRELVYLPGHFRFRVVTRVPGKIQQALGEEHPIQPHETPVEHLRTKPPVCGPLRLWNCQFFRCQVRNLGPNTPAGGGSWVM